MTKPKKQQTKCVVNSHWFTKLDSDGQPVNRWLKDVTGSSVKVHCSICKADLNCELKGFQTVTQHIATAKHQKLFREVFAPAQLRLQSVQNVVTSSISRPTLNAPAAASSRKQVTLYDSRDDATKAEIIWTMRTVACNQSGRSCESAGPTLKAMFPNKVVSSEFSLGKFKFSYLLSDCVGPHFREIFLRDLKGCHYVLCFDETTNDASKSELHVSVRYYSVRNKRVVQCHLETFFIENGCADTIAGYLLKALDNAKVPIDKMITLSRDGPNVNKKVLRLIKEQFKAKTGRELLDLGSCDLHTVHNAFKAGLTVFGSDVSDLIIKTYYFFNGEALRSEEYRDIQKKLKMPEPFHRFIKHVPTRWLTLQESTVQYI